MRRPASPPSESVVRIERIGAEGDGIGFVAAHPDGAPAVYIPFTLPGETVRARLAGDRGEALAIVEPSAERIEPPCPHFGACGGCALQHWRADASLGWKSGRVAQALRRAGWETAPFRPPVRTPPGSRRRLDLALRRDRSGVTIGLHRLRGTEVIDLGTCPVAHPDLVRLIAPLRALLAETGLMKSQGSAIINRLDSGPDLLLRTDAAPTAQDRAAATRFAQAHGLPRISWARGTGTSEPICVLRPPTVTLSGATVTPPPGGFLQASAEGERGIVAAVLDGLPAPLPSRARIVELYAGCGTLTFALAALARVTAFEGDAAALEALRRAANQAGLAGRINAGHRDLARQPLTERELAQAAAVVLDPPFAGAPAQMQAIAAARPERVVYVSCNPAVLARDAAVLHRAGYRPVAVTLIDQFLWSARIESVCVFGR